MYKPIQPHLVRIDLLVPEAAAGCARLVAELAAQQFEGGSIAPITGAVIEGEQQLAWVDLIEVEFTHPVGANFAIFVHKVIHPCLIDTS